MPRLNLVLMSVFSAAVVAIGALMALEGGGPSAPDPDAALRKLIRRLADSDPDVRRDAEAGLKRLGPGAVPALRKAATLDDAVLATRAARVLEQIEGAPVVRRDPAPGSGAPPASVTVELQLLLLRDRIKAGEAPDFYVRLSNPLAHPVLVARHRIAGLPVYGCFAQLEIRAEDGSTLCVPVDLEAPPGAALEIFAVGPETTAELLRCPPGNIEFAGRLAKPGRYEIRILYDAGAESAYQNAVARAHPPEGAPLPAARLASNAVLLVVE